MADAMKDGWRMHADEQRRAWLRLSPERRLELLEQLKNFCRESLGLAHPELRSKLPWHRRSPPT